jgi:flagellar FliJ protein
MAKFVYRLQSYLNLKEQVEELKKNEYGYALRRLEEERQKKLQLEAEQEAIVKIFRKSLLVSIKPVDIRRFNNRIELLKVWIIEQEQRVKQAEQEAEEKRLALVEAMKERKALETVRERSYEDYKLEEKRNEQVVVDGIVSYQYADKMSV